MLQEFFNLVALQVKKISDQLFTLKCKYFTEVFNFHTLLLNFSFWLVKAEATPFFAISFLSLPHPWSQYRSQLFFWKADNK